MACYSIRTKLAKVSRTVNNPNKVNGEIKESPSHSDLDICCNYGLLFILTVLLCTVDIADTLNVIYHLLH